MSMYDRLAGKYDQMISWKTRLERETPFFQRLFNEKRIRRVLDLACGTGHHSHLFHKWGCDVIGVDPSAPLLEIAREGTSAGDGTIRFVEAGFLDFSEHVDKPVDAVICLGNSLPHLLNDDDMRRMLANVHDILVPGGVFIFQNRNYDRLLETRERFQFPTAFRAADNEQIFFRFNDFEKDLVRFNVVHFTRVGEGWIHEVFSTELRPWKQAGLEELVREAGFVARNYYGDFSGTPFDAKASGDLIGLMRRGGEAAS